MSGFFREGKKSPLSNHSINSICLRRSKLHVSYRQPHATNTTALKCSHGYVVQCHFISIKPQSRVPINRKFGVQISEQPLFTITTGGGGCVLVYSRKHSPEFILFKQFVCWHQLGIWKRKVHVNSKFDN